MRYRITEHQMNGCPRFFVEEKRLFGWKVRALCYSEVEATTWLDELELAIERGRRPMIVHEREIEI